MVIRQSSNRDGCLKMRMRLLVDYFNAIDCHVVSVPFPCPLPCSTVAVGKLIPRSDDLVRVKSLFSLDTEDC
jgi:hypothetical protein